MGPIALFDKSFIQALTVDESVWFDHFFIANVCPIFFVETLADLGKSVREGRTPEQEVRIIASKFPEMHSAPCSHHTSMCIASLMGHQVPMTGQIPVSGGRPAASGSERGVVFKRSPESEAFSRWQHSQFKDLERDMASDWREQLANLDLESIAKNLREIGIDGSTCKDLNDAYQIASTIVRGAEKPFQKMALVFAFFGISDRRMQHEILQRWDLYSRRPLNEFAPYAAYVLTVDLFFHIAIASHQISSERPSNRVDIAYLYYLPFCHVFVSSDRLHRRSVEPFLRDGQVFVWGPDLKQDLANLNQHYSDLPEEVKELGVMRFAGTPPLEGGFLTTEIWNRIHPGWKPRPVEREERVIKDPEREAALVAKLRKLADAPPIAPEEVDFDPSDPESLTIERTIAKKKGRWWQIPKNLKDSDQ